MAPSYSVPSEASETAIGNAPRSIREHSSSSRRSLVDLVFSTMDPTITACGPWHDVAMEHYNAYLTCLTRNERTISFLRWGSVWNIALTCRRFQEVMKALLRIPIYFGQVQLGRSTLVHVMGLLGCSICGAQGAQVDLDWCVICRRWARDAPQTVCASCHFVLTANPAPQLQLRKVDYSYPRGSERRERPVTQGDTLCLGCASEGPPEFFPRIAMRQAILRTLYRHGVELMYRTSSNLSAGRYAAPPFLFDWHVSGWRADTDFQVQWGALQRGTAAARRLLRIMFRRWRVFRARRLLRMIFRRWRCGVYCRCSVRFWVGMALCGERGPDSGER